MLMVATGLTSTKSRVAPQAGAGDDDLLDYGFLRMDDCRGEARARGRACDQSALHCLTDWLETVIHQLVPPNWLQVRPAAGSRTPLIGATAKLPGCSR